MAPFLLHMKRAVGLRSADFMGKSDPYVRIQIEVRRLTVAS